MRLRKDHGHTARLYDTIRIIIKHQKPTTPVIDTIHDKTTIKSQSNNPRAFQLNHSLYKRIYRRNKLTTIAILHLENCNKHQDKINAMKIPINR